MTTKYCYVKHTAECRITLSTGYEFQIAFSEEFQSDSTIQCHLSPETSAVDMEIRWFKETDCVCFYKNRRLIEGESYEGIMSLCTEELERGIVSLQLKDVRESHVGDYLCQVTSGDRTAEITIRKCECFIYCNFTSSILLSE
uniref:Si:dkey-27p18.7 n=1 Tax=Cyprinus carpio TaxID=7962 RepID=A0A8C2CZ28_CYPCA